MVPEHVSIAKVLAAKPEEELADASEPEALDLAIACARTAYDVGSLYLHALQARRRAARTGSSTALMRWSVAVAQTREMVRADADS